MEALRTVGTVETPAEAQGGAQERVDGAEVLSIARYRMRRALADSVAEARRRADALARLECALRAA